MNDGLKIDWKDILQLDAKTFRSKSELLQELDSSVENPTHNQDYSQTNPSPPTAESTSNILQKVLRKLDMIDSRVHSTFGRLKSDISLINDGFRSEIQDLKEDIKQLVDDFDAQEKLQQKLQTMQHHVYQQTQLVMQQLLEERAKPQNAAAPSEVNLTQPDKEEAARVPDQQQAQHPENIHPQVLKVSNEQGNSVHKTKLEQRNEPVAKKKEENHT